MKNKRWLFKWHIKQYNVSCFYCGKPAEEIDHVIPKKHLKNIKIDKRRILLIQSCSECNRLLHDSYQNSLEERKQELKNRLKRKYKKFLEMPNWTQEEINELGPVLKQNILIAQEYKKITNERLKW